MGADPCSEGMHLGLGSLEGGSPWLARPTASRRPREIHAPHCLSTTLRRKDRAVYRLLCARGHCGPGSAGGWGPKPGMVG